MSLVNTDGIKQCYQVCDLDRLIWDENPTWTADETTIYVKGICPICHRIYREVYLAKGIIDEEGDYVRDYDFTVCVS